MIYTVTLNPSIDYVVQMNELTVGAVNRTETEQFFPGGKGINVSQILTQLGHQTVALGFISGFTGAFIESELEKKKIESKFIKLSQGVSRINMKVKAQEETELNGQGPHIHDEAVKKLYAQLDELTDQDWLVLAGSIPNTMPTDFYEQIMRYLSEKNIKIVVDATNDLLMNVLKFHPFLIKPNHHELAEMFNVIIQTEEELIVYGKKLQEMGARNVLISRGKEGAILISESGEIFASNVPNGIVLNSVGAGDSMVAGFIAGYLSDKNYATSLQLGAAAGSATAFSKDVATKSYIDTLYPEILIKKLS